MDNKTVQQDCKNLTSQRLWSDILQNYFKLLYDKKSVYHGDVQNDLESFYKSSDWNNLISQIAYEISEPEFWVCLLYPYRNNKKFKEWLETLYSYLSFIIEHDSLDYKNPHVLPDGWNKLIKDTFNHQNTHSLSKFYRIVKELLYGNKNIMDDILSTTHNLNNALNVYELKDSINYFKEHPTVYDEFNRLCIGGIIAVGLLDMVKLVAIAALLYFLGEFSNWINAQKWIPAWIKSLLLTAVGKVTNSLQQQKQQIETNWSTLADKISQTNKLLGEILHTGLDMLYNSLNGVGETIAKYLSNNADSIIRALAEQTRDLTEAQQKHNEEMIKHEEQGFNELQQSLKTNVNNIATVLQETTQQQIRYETAAYQTEYVSMRADISTFVGIGLEPFVAVNKETNVSKTLSVLASTVSDWLSLAEIAVSPTTSYFEALLHMFGKFSREAGSQQGILGSIIGQAIALAFKGLVINMLQLAEFDPKRYVKSILGQLQANKELISELKQIMPPQAQNRLSQQGYPFGNINVPKK